MTRKDFDLIADLIREQASLFSSESAHRAFACRAASLLSGTNPRFDYDRFVHVAAPEREGGATTPIGQLHPGDRFTHPALGEGIRVAGSTTAPAGTFVNLRREDGRPMLVHEDLPVNPVRPETMRVLLEGEDYVIRFAFRAGRPGAENLPLTFAKDAWRKIEDHDRPVPDRWTPITTLAGNLIEVRRADCGAGCRCALEWRPA